MCIAGNWIIPRKRYSRKRWTPTHRVNKCWCRCKLGRLRTRKKNNTQSIDVSYVIQQNREKNTSCRSYIYHLSFRNRAFSLNYISIFISCEHFIPISILSFSSCFFFFFVSFIYFQKNKELMNDIITNCKLKNGKHFSNVSFTLHFSNQPTSGSKLHRKWMFTKK